MNMMRIFYIGLSGVGMMFSSMASGHDAGGLQSPACGVVCDPYICVNSDGISPELTRKYLGEKAAENLQSLQGYDPSEFTFANWICPYISRHLLSLNPLLACCRRYSRG
ncbi:YcgJ family protein, partial [Escherichia coli]|nr:YcgJ family protein [Escherichia coli]